MKCTKPTFTLGQIAEHWGCSHGTVLSHVYSGELVAIDISTNPAGRSRYIVRAEDLEEFERRRTTLPVQAKAKRRTRARIRPGEVTEFIQ